MYLPTVGDSGGGTELTRASNHDAEGSLIRKGCVVLIHDELPDSCRVIAAPEFGKSVRTGDPGVGRNGCQERRLRERLPDDCGLPLNEGA